MMKAHRISPDTCPTCGKTLDAASALSEGRGPEPGDLSVCLGCESVLRFNADLKLEALSEDAIAALPPNAKEDVAQIKEMLAWVKAKVKGEGKPSQGKP